MLCLLLLALAGPLVRYDVAESVSSTTPRGEDVRAVTGRITSVDGKAVWELTGGTFPRSSARVAIADGGVLTLLDTRERVYAAATLEDFDAFFVPRAGEEGGASFTPHDVHVEVTREGKGAPFGDASTVRYRVKGSWRLVMQAPGRAGTVVSEVSGALVVAPDLRPTPFDDPMRLVPVRGAVRDAFAEELARAGGLAVKVDLTITSEVRTERVGAAPGAPDRPVRPPRTVTRIARTLSTPERRHARAADAALFAVPEGFHSRGLERLAPAAAAP